MTEMNPDQAALQTEFDAIRATLERQKSLDHDEFMTEEELAELAEIAIQEIEAELVNKGLLSQEKWSELKTKLQRLTVIEDLNQSPETKEIKETDVEAAMEEIIAAITSAKLWLFVKTTGESQQKAILAIYTNSDFPKDEIELSADGAVLAEKIIAALDISDTGRQTIRDTVKAFMKTGFLAGKFALRKTENGAIEIQETEGGEWKPLEQAPAESAQVPVSPDSGEQARLKLSKYLGEGKPLAEINGFAAEEPDLKDLVASIIGSQVGVAAIRYNAEKFEVNIPENGQDNWKTVELQVNSTAAEKYLSSLENFDSKIKEWEKAHPFMSAISKILAKMFGVDIRAWIEDPTFVGGIVREMLEITIEEKDFPQKTNEVQAELEQFIKRNQKGPEIGKVEGEGAGDTMVQKMLEDLRIFSTEGAPIQMIESKSTKGKDSPETAGKMVLECPMASQAAALVLYAQRSSKNFTDTFGEYVEKLEDGKMKEMITGLMGDADNEKNDSYAKMLAEKEYPDNTLTRYRGKVNGKYQVEVTWFSDGNIEESPKSAPAPTQEAELAP